MTVEELIHQSLAELDELYRGVSRHCQAMSEWRELMETKQPDRDRIKSVLQDTLSSVAVIERTLEYTDRVYERLALIGSRPSVQAMNQMLDALENIMRTPSGHPVSEQFAAFEDRYGMLIQTLEHTSCDKPAPRRTVH